MFNKLNITSKDKWPPSNPKSGDLFINFNEDNSKDFLADGLNWISRGTHKIPKTNPTMIVRYFQRRHGKNVLNFHKKCFSKCQNETKDFRTFIHYYGEDLKFREAPHGNTRKNNRPHIKTMKSCIESQVLNSNAPSVTSRGCTCGETERFEASTK